MSAVPSSSALSATSLIANGSRNLWAYAVAPEFVSPLSISSPDGSQTGTISVANASGNMTIVPDLSGAKIRIGNGNNLFMSPSGNTNAELVVEDDGDVGFYQGPTGNLFVGGASGSIAFQHLSVAPNLRVGTLSGRVYDTVYNKPITISVLQPEIGGPIAYNVISNVDAGVYQLQFSGETTVPGSEALNMFATDEPSTAVVNFSGVEVLPASVGANLLSMVSGYFTYDGIGGLRVRLETAGTPWTAVWTLQLIKIV